MTTDKKIELIDYVDKLDNLFDEFAVEVDGKEVYRVSYEEMIDSGLTEPYAAVHAVLTSLGVPFDIKTVETSEDDDEYDGDDGDENTSDDE